MEIQLIENQTKGFAIAKENGKTAGKMTYSVPASDFIIIDHTEVDPEFRGKDVGKKLLYKIVDMARAKQIKILPLCSFVHAMFTKTAEIKDVLKTN
ncbi:GNAT family N-acetyltransferase [Formosa sp. PL04]|uniref:GNAT family N-acetyltransferase n=1 Tax=Formosa sp. PL04 TaxID=3081755 RepID=UPI0029827A24|nr:GNAT family N-acetyltransferase [Formosa sp. PL04]MDW5290100.1 GNAT family N-acetyltransferase [Formosa sp. PL04]